MTKELNSRDLANLDPYNRRSSRSTNSARELLGEDVESSSLDNLGKENRAEFVEKLVFTEKEAWKKVLGKDIYVDKPPSALTPEFIKKCEENGMIVRFRPAISAFLGERDDFVNWKRVQDIPKKDLSNWDIVRTLPDDYWNDLYNNKLKGESLYGYWMAIENKVPFKNSEVNYSELPLSRFFTGDRSWTVIGAEKELSDRKGEIFKELGIHYSDAYILLPSALDYNLLMNRDKLSTGNSSLGEWTSVSARNIILIGGEKQLVMGFHSDLGAADVRKEDGRTVGSGAEGFRVKIQFK